MARRKQTLKISAVEKAAKEIRKEITEIKAELLELCCDEYLKGEDLVDLNCRLNVINNTLFYLVDDNS